MAKFILPEELTGTLALAYGKHVVSGHVVQKVTEGFGDNASTTVIVWLGEGPWNKIIGYWGGAIIPDTDIHFHNGYLSSSMDVATQAVNPATGMSEWNQGVDPWNVGGQTYSGTAYAIVKLPLGISSEDDFSPLKFVCECLRVADYDSQGRQLNKDGVVVGTVDEDPKEEWFFYSTNAALCMADAILVRRGLTKNRINWPKWVEWKNVCGAQITWKGGSVADRPIFTNTTSNFSVGANSGVLKTSGGNAWNCGGITESVMPDNTISFFEVDAGAGTWSAGLTTTTNLVNSNQFWIAAQGNVANAGDESGILSLNISGVNQVFGNWVAGDRFRFGVDIQNNTPFLYIAKNGIRLDTSSLGTIRPYVSGLHGGVALFHEGADILRASMSPINVGVSGGERKRTRFECGLAYTSTTDINAIIESILYVSCSEIQDVDGKLVFLPPTMISAPRQSVMDINESIILPNTFKSSRRQREQKPTKLPGRFRDADTPTLKEDTREGLRESLVDLLGYEKVEPEVYLGTITAGQAECVLNYYIRRLSDLDLFCEFETNGLTWKLLPGNVVRVSKDELNWNNVKFEIIQAEDLSSLDTPDNRKFICQIFNEACYSDTDQTPLNSTVTDLVTNEISIPEMPTGLTATLLLNSVKYKWDRPEHFKFIREYEIWSTPDTTNVNNRLWHGLADGWIEPFTAGAPNIITRYVRAVSITGKIGPFASVTKNLDTVIPPSNYTISYDNKVIHHNFSPSNPATGVMRYEISRNANFTDIIFSALDTQFDETVSAPGAYTRFLRAIGLLEKPSSTVTASTSVAVPAPPTNASVTYDGFRFNWNWTASVSTNIAYYEITNSTGTVIIERVPFTHWQQPQIRGVASYSSRVYTVTDSGLRSTQFLVLGTTIPAPNPITGLIVSFDSNSGQIKWSWTNSTSIDVESIVLVDNAGVLPALVVNKNSNTALEQPTENVPVLRRNAFVISTNGQQSSQINATFTATIPQTPVITLNRQYPVTADVNVVGTIAAKAVKNTITKVSTGTGVNFNANIIQTLPESGKQEHVTILGRASQNTNLFIKVFYKDVWGQNSPDSNELALTFTPFLGSDLSNNTVTSLQLLLNNFDNIADNPGFENGTSLPVLATEQTASGWIFDPHCYLYKNTTSPLFHSGGACARRNGPTNGGSAGTRVIKNLIKADCKPGDQFYIEGFVNPRSGAVSGDTLGVRIIWYDKDFNELTPTTLTLNASTLIANSWNLIGGTGTAPVNASFARPAFVSTINNGSLEFAFDNIYFRRMITSTIIGVAVIQTAHIAELAVTNAKILNLSVEKLVAAAGDFGLLFADRIVSRDFAAVPNASTQLNGAINDTQASIIVDSTTAFPASGSISVFNTDGSREVIYYTGKTSTTFTGCVRGKEASLPTAHADNSPVFARGLGWMFHPQRDSNTPGAIEANSNIYSQGIHIDETAFRAAGAISANRNWRGNTVGVVPPEYIGQGFIEISYGELDRAFVSLGILIDNFEEAESGYGSIDYCEIVIRNKFGEIVNPNVTLRRSWKGQGHIGDFTYGRKYADAWEEAAFEIRIHNYHGLSKSIYISNARKAAGWGSEMWSATIAPVFLARQNCPLELVASPDGPDTVKLTWQTPIANRSTQFVNARKRGSDGWQAWENISGAGISSTANTFTWTDAQPFTDYEFFIQNTGSTSATSNIAFCKTPPQGVTTSRPAPSNVVGSPQSPTTILWNWTRNAVDNTDVEVSLDGGAWTSLGSATATTTTSTVGAGTTHTLRVRNKWSSGTLLSGEADSNVVTTTTSAPALTDPSNLNLSTPLRKQIHLEWTNNGNVNQTVEYKPTISGGAWTVISLGAVNVHNIINLFDNVSYDVRVKATSGVNYIMATTTTQEAPDIDRDKITNCVLTDSLITLERGLVDEAINIKTQDVIMTGKYNEASVEESVLGTTSSYIVIHDEFGNSLGGSPSHPMIVNQQETAKMTLSEVYQLVTKNQSVYVKRNEFGKEFMARIKSVEWIFTAMPVWIPKLSHENHTFIANGFVCHNIKAM